MWVYALEGTKKYVATNPKVMTSALNRQPSLRRVVGKRRYLEFALGSISPTFGPNFTLLARNPFGRVESFFREKLRIRVYEARDGARELKRHQSIFYPWLGVSDTDSVSQRCEALLDLSFADFVSLLPRVAHLEDHLNPQIHNYTRAVGPMHWVAHFDHIVHVEDDDAMALFADEFNLDLGTRDNDSSAARVNLAWSAPMVAIVHRLYRDDFRTLGYRLEDNPFLGDLGEP